MHKMLPEKLIKTESKKLPGCSLFTFNTLPHMPILGSSNSAANKDMMSKILTNGDNSFLIE